MRCASESTAPALVRSLESFGISAPLACFSGIPEKTWDAYETVYMQLRCQLEERCKTWRQTYESINFIANRLPQGLQPLQNFATIFAVCRDIYVSDSCIVRSKDCFRFNSPAVESAATCRYVGLRFGPLILLRLASLLLAVVDISQETKIKIHEVTLSIAIIQGSFSVGNVAVDVARIAAFYRMAAVAKADLAKIGSMSFGRGRRYPIGNGRYVEQHERLARRVAEIK